MFHMEAASRPTSDPLPDLPVEDPSNGVSAKAARPLPTAAADQPAAADKPAAAAQFDPATTQTLLKMELLVGDGEAPAAPPPVLKAAAPETPQVLEVDPDAPLSLEDTFEVDRMLSSPPPPAAAAPTAAPGKPAPRPSSLDETATLTLIPDIGSPSPPKPTVTAPPAKPAEAAKTAASESQPPALVPLARRASLTAAAMKLAAASAAAPQPEPKPAPPPVAAPVKSRPAATGAAASVTPIAKAAGVASTPAAPAAPPAAAPASSAAPPAEAPSLASWANARAAAAASARTAPSAPAAAAAPTPVRPSAPAAKPGASAIPEKSRSSPSAPAAPPAASAPAASQAAAMPARGMDRDFIARNQVVERYLSGKLPIKAATDFERYCKEHPQLLDELGLPERVNAGLRLLEASGKPEPWQEASKPFWQKPAAVLGLAGLAALLAFALSIVATSSAGKTHRILDLQRQVADRTLDAATSTRVVRLLPNRSGASSAPAIVIGGGEAQLVDFRIDETRSPYKDFRVTIDRVDQGRVMIIDNLSKDSNGHLRVAINSSAFGPGNYLLTIEGLTMRLEPQPDSWVTIGVVQR